MQTTTRQLTTPQTIRIRRLHPKGKGANNDLSKDCHKATRAKTTPYIPTHAKGNERYHPNNTTTQPLQNAKASTRRRTPHYTTHTRGTHYAPPNYGTYYRHTRRGRPTKARQRLFPTLDYGVVWAGAKTTTREFIRQLYFFIYILLSTTYTCAFRSEETNMYKWGKTSERRGCTSNNKMS